MTAPGLLMAIGTMFVLLGVVILGATLAGVRLPSRRSWPMSASRLWPQLKPIHGVAALVGLAVLLLTGWVAIGVAAGGAVVLVPSILAAGGRNERISRLEALGSWIRRVADLLVSGAASSLESALAKSAKVAPSAIAPEVNLLASRLGPQSARLAILGFARDLADPISDEVAMALILQLRHGGRGLAEVLAGIATAVDDQIRMRREVEADRAKARSNVRTLVLLTLTMSTAMVVFARGFLAPYSTPEGQFALAGVVGVFATAVLWLRHMVRPVPGVRLLTQADFLTEPRP